MYGIILGIVVIAAIFITSFFAFDPKNPAAQQQAITDALEWQNSEVRACGMAITPAVHKVSGATYTFNTTCLPPGWDAR